MTKKEIAAFVDTLIDAIRPALVEAVAEADSPAEEEAPAPKKKGKPVVEEDDEDEDETPAPKKKAGKLPDPDDVVGMDRSDVKELAETLGVDSDGVKIADLRVAVTAALKKAAKKAKPIVEDDDEDEAPVAKRGKKAKPVEDDDEEEEAPAKKKGKSKGPSIDEKREDLEAFFKSKYIDEELEDEFFTKPGKKDKYDAEAPLAWFLLNDDDLLAEAWEDNVKPIKDADEWGAIEKNVKAYHKLYDADLFTGQ